MTLQARLEVRDTADVETALGDRLCRSIARCILVCVRSVSEPRAVPSSVIEDQLTLVIKQGMPIR